MSRRRVALNRMTVNIPNAYESKTFDFSGTHAFDESMGYRSQSFLTIPLMSNDDSVIGVIQLINARSRVRRGYALRGGTAADY